MQALLRYLLNNSGIKPLRPALPVPRRDGIGRRDIPGRSYYRCNIYKDEVIEPTHYESGLGQG